LFHYNLVQFFKGLN